MACDRRSRCRATSHIVKVPLYFTSFPCGEEYTHQWVDPGASNRGYTLEASVLVM